MDTASRGRVARTDSRFIFFRSILLAAAIGTCAGLAVAQVTGAGQLDPACNADCTARGYDSEFCTRVCTAPEAGIVPADVEVDWICLRGCRDRGGRLRDCISACQRR